MNRRLLVYELDESAHIRLVSDGFLWPIAALLHALFLDVPYGSVLTFPATPLGEPDSIFGLSVKKVRDFPDSGAEHIHAFLVDVPDYIVDSMPTNALGFSDATLAYIHKPLRASGSYITEGINDGTVR
jgi:hypothetical protein